MNSLFSPYNPDVEPPIVPLTQQERQHFVGEVLPTAEKLKQELPQLYLGAPLSVFIADPNGIWIPIKEAIIRDYPEYSELLGSEEIVFRTFIRPHRNNLVLPGHNDRNINTMTSVFRYGLDYEPTDGEWIGMTEHSPWANYMMPHGQFTDEVNTHILIYDNRGCKLLQPGETACQIRGNNMLAHYLRMHICITWRKDSHNEQNTHITTNDLSKGSDVALRRALANAGWQI